MKNHWLARYEARQILTDRTTIEIDNGWGGTWLVHRSEDAEIFEITCGSGGAAGSNGANGHICFTYTVTLE
jgi:hypothetical protein